ncbi:MAG: carbohydrate binding family 9 domain-containing protein [Phycisphaerae bacterium]|nr:carbohydrate binding family 9 domain-containing protein [Gemmatimonadaceae bacterium]
MVLAYWSAVAGSATLAPGQLRAQGPTTPALKHARAARLTGAAPGIDGTLDEAVWSQAQPITDFVQKIPIEGATPSVSTEVRVLYDDHAIYLGARLFRKDPAAIRTSITRRDGESDAETFTMSLDTYLDRRTAYSFTISSGGVRGDAYHAQDSEDSGRETQFDPIWNARAKVDREGWVAEMRIPFSQLRFNAASEQVWGMQLTRNVADIAERVQWTLIPIQAAGFSSRFGRLEGIAGVPPKQRIEVLPYFATDLNYRANEIKANPFINRSDARIGGDLKIGLGPNLTLDATINPDFGQVEADPAVVNLTAFEQVFDERRPFFIEGNELLTGRGQSFIGRPSWFYSRRVGASPRGSASGDFVDFPTNTTIAGAAKVTGRLKSGLSVGALAAVTPREYARTFRIVNDSTGRTAVEPPSTFGIVRLQQEFGKQQSNVGLSLTNVQRWLDERGGLQTLLPSSAIAGGVDWKLRYKQGMYEITGWAGGSYVQGDSLAITRLQRNSAHFFQRPDQTHIRFEPGRTSLSGATASLRLDKNAGRFTLGGIQLSMRSPEFEINDAGQMRSGDDIDFNADIQLRDTKPNKFVRLFNFGTSTQAGWNFGGVRQYFRIGENASATLHNFMRVNVGATRIFGSLSDDLTRGGPLIGTQNAYQLTASLNSRANVPTTWSLRGTYLNDEFGGWTGSGGATLTIRPSSRWQASIDPTYSRLVDPRQYVSTRAGTAPNTYGQRYIFAYIERSTLSARFRLNYAFTPNFTVEGYAEPFTSSGRYFDFGELLAARSKELRQYGAAGTGTTINRDSVGIRTVRDGAQIFAIPQLDFNRLSFRSNLVLRWEWLPGSTAFLIWQQSRAEADASGRLISARDLAGALAASGDHFLVAKISYLFGVR